MADTKEFPKWNPQRTTLRMCGSSNYRERYTALRNSSSAFIARKDVREYLFKKYNHKCYLCGSTEDLQIDHIVSVYRFAYERIPAELLNSEDNLAAICKKCNLAKTPDK